MTKEEMFLQGHKKSNGLAVAKQMLKEYRDTHPVPKSPSKVYLNEFGEEVHVNGDIAASLQKSETLQERIARFDRLAAAVAAIRLARFSADPEHFDEFEDENPSDDSLLDDVQEFTDDFKDTVAEPKKPVADATVPPISAGEVSDDESVSPATKVASEMDADGETIEK